MQTRVRQITEEEANSRPTPCIVMALPTGVRNGVNFQPAVLEVWRTYDANLFDYPQGQWVEVEYKVLEDE